MHPISFTDECIFDIALSRRYVECEGTNRPIVIRMLLHNIELITVELFIETDGCESKNFVFLEMSRSDSTALQPNELSNRVH